MKYIVAEFKIACYPELLQVARDLVANAAGEAGFESFEETPDGLKGYVLEQLFDREMLDRNLAELLLDAATVSYTLHPTEDKDWNEQWEQEGFSPIDIGGRVLIYDARQPAPAIPAQAVGVSIRARQAFGTGTHQTTRLMIASLLDSPLQGKRVLDCGCGTGVLGLVAAKLGAREVVAYDIDEWSVENAKHNAQENHVENLTVLHGDAQVLSHVSGLFELVMANINRNILLHDMPAFAEMLTADGTLIISGFYEEDAPLLLAEAEKSGFREQGRQTEDRWCCLRLAK